MTKFIKVKSKSIEGKEYTVRVFPTGEIRCECPGFVFSGKCRHVKEVAAQILKGLKI